jgi:hypothetical protein
VVAGYWAGLDAGKFNGVFLWPNIVAMALAGSPIIVVLIALGYILNSRFETHERGPALQTEAVSV